MEINNKMVQIIEMLFLMNRIISIETVMEELHLSKRSLLYHIDKLNYIFSKIDVEKIKVVRGQIHWEHSDEEEIRSALYEVSTQYYVMLKLERKLWICLFSAIGFDAITIERLCNEFQVSRNTIITEITELKAELSKRGIELYSYGKKGYRLSGDEVTIRSIIMESYYELQANLRFRNLDQDIIKEAEKCSRRVVDQHKGIFDIINECEGYTNLKYNSKSIQEMGIYILITLIRSHKGCHTDFSEDFSGEMEFMAAEEIVRTMQREGFPISMEEQQYITVILLASKVFSRVEMPQAVQMLGNTHVASVDLKQFVRDILEFLEQTVYVKFYNKEEFVAKLLLHVQPMYYRLKYKIKTKNVLLDDIKSRYQELYHLTDIAIKAVEPKYRLVIPDEDIAFLCIYIASWLMQHHDVECAPDADEILIVCGAGVGTSLLIKEQVVELLGMEYRYIIKEYRDVCEEDYVRCKLLITTLPLDFSDETGKVVKVNPILSRGQQSRLIEFGMKRSSATEEKQVAELMAIIKKYAKVKDERELAHELVRYLQQNTTTKPEQDCGVWDLLTMDCVQIVQEKVTFEKAVQIGCKPLVQRGVVTSAYADGIIAITEKMGLYAELTSGVWLAHGEIDENVFGLGLTFTAFSEGVYFAKGDKEIRLIITLATTNHQEHLGVLRDILKILNDEKAYQYLMDCSFAHQMELYEYIMAMVKAE